jgi:peptide/nickel transport system permease protein
MTRVEEALIDTELLTAEAGPATPVRSATARRRRRLRIGVVLAGGFLGVAALGALLAPWIAPFGVNEQNYDRILQGPSGTHWLGTDDLGRDMLTRLMHGARVSLMSSLVAVSVGLAVGLPLGIVAGYLGGVTDSVLTRILDTLLAFPTIVLAIAVTATLGTGMTNAMVAVGIVIAPSFGRMIRAQVMVVRRRLYVESAVMMGLSRWWILRRHLLPNAIQPIIVLCAHMLGVALLVEASLSFLGLGTPPPTPSWGGMLRDASRVVDGVAVQTVLPGLAIALSLLSFNTLGDWLRDLLDPRHTR